MKIKLKFLYVCLILLFSSLASESTSVTASSLEIIPADRRVDWGFAGIPGGIPERKTICQIIDGSVYGNGSTDATQVIQAALRNCPAGQVVYLPAGVYIISNTIRMRNNDTLRGAGPGITILKYIGGDVDSMVSIMSYAISWQNIHHITEANKDSQVITLSNTTGITTGDVLLLNQLNDGVLVDTVGTNGKCTHCGIGGGDRALGQFVEVTAVAGPQVSLNVPLHWTYDPTLDPWAYQLEASWIVRYAGLEDLTLTQDTPAVLDMVRMQGAQYSWIKNVEIKNIQNHAIYIIESLQNEIQGCYVHNGLEGYGTGSGYGISLTYQSSNNLVEDNILSTIDGGGVTTGGGASGNVIAYNYFHDIMFDDPNWLIASPGINHGAHPKMNLWEGNIAYKAEGDFIWGSSSHNTIFRSQSKGWWREITTSRNNAIEIAKKNYYMNVIGSVLGTPGKSNKYEVFPNQTYDQNHDNVIWALGVDNSVMDPNVAPTLLRHGNFDYFTNTVIWDPAIPNHDLPDSLYLNQVPGWWCQETPWPAIGPDVAGLVNKIPAERRFEGLPCLRKDALTLTAIAANEAIVLNWKLNGTFSLPTTWRIDYTGPAGYQPSPIIGIPADTRSFTLTGLTNYTWYAITLSTDPPWLSEIITLFPTNHFFHLPIISKEDTSFLLSGMNHHN